jgi:Zinc carboxypeptidase
MIQREFTELRQLEALIARLGSYLQVEVIAELSYRNQPMPVHCLSLGSQSGEVPTIVYVGGIHGLEKIGTEVLLNYLQSIAELLEWDGEWLDRLSKLRLVFVPIVNPIGVYRGTRCNGNNVDLMRNAPIHCVGKTKIYSGQTFSPHLPWYRGDLSQMETEAQALCDIMRRELARSPLVIAVDLHSGFGLHDRLWFPYAGSRQPFPSLPQAYALKQLFDRCYPHHVYKIEPMSQEYVISGDLWDYLYEEALRKHPQTLFMPLTLEMGSWLWLRKSPLHLFQRHGLFHPLLPHRQQRIFRRHLTLFDFLSRAALYPQSWSELSEAQKTLYRQQAYELWYA